MQKTIRNILILAIATAFALVPAKSMAQDQKPQVEMEQNAISVSLTGTALHVKNAEHMVIEIFSITGEKIFTARIESASKSFEVDNLSKGCYIVRIGKFTRKIYVK